MKTVQPNMEVAIDVVVEANRQELLERSRVGLKKYGVPLDKSRLSFEQVTQHAIEEALDLANYLQTLRLTRDRNEVLSNKVITLMESHRMTGEDRNLLLKVIDALRGV